MTITYEEFVSLPAVEPYFDVEVLRADGSKMIVPHMTNLKMVWLEEDEPRGWIIDGFWWVKAEDENGQLVRVRGRSA